MRDDERDDDSAHEPSEEEMGPPVDLSPLTEDDGYSPFVGRVRRALHRRLLGSSVLEFCVVGPAVVALELLLMIGSIFRGHESNGGSR